MTVSRARRSRVLGGTIAKLVLCACVMTLGATAVAAASQSARQAHHHRSAHAARRTHTAGASESRGHHRRSAHAAREAHAAIASARGHLHAARRAHRRAYHNLEWCRHRLPHRAHSCAAARRRLTRTMRGLVKARRRLARRKLRAAKIRARAARRLRSAPHIAAAGRTIRWNAVGTVKRYVFVRKVPGHADQYSDVQTTSLTPPPVAGATVDYSVRTAVAGSKWAPEVAIHYPAQTTAKPAGGKGVEHAKGPRHHSKEPTETEVQESTTTSTETSETTVTSTETSSTSEASTGSSAPTESSASTQPFEMGIVAGSALSYELPFIQKLGAHTARMEFEIGTPASQMAPIIEEYARAGIRPLLLAGFYGTLPSPAEAKNLASWAAEFGPGGNFWSGKSMPAGTAVTDIEFGNETSYSYQFSDNSESAIESRAQTYAVRFKEAYEAVQAVNPSVGLLAQGDPGNDGTEWVNNMFKAVPNLGQLVAGWTVHPYGPKWKSIMDEVISTTQADGASSSIPLYVTEWGLASDNGRCLDGNYGWNPCMTYSEAASTLSSTVSEMRSTYGSRLASLYVFQAHDQAASGTTTSFGKYFGALQSNAEPKGAYTTTVESLLAGNP